MTEAVEFLKERLSDLRSYKEHCREQISYHQNWIGKYETEIAKTDSTFYIKQERL